MAKSEAVNENICLQNATIIDTRLCRPFIAVTSEAVPFLNNFGGIIGDLVVLVSW